MAKEYYYIEVGTDYYVAKETFETDPHLTQQPEPEDVITIKRPPNGRYGMEDVLFSKDYEFMNKLARNIQEMIEHDERLMEERGEYYQPIRVHLWAVDVVGTYT